MVDIKSIKEGDKVLVVGNGYYKFPTPSIEAMIGHVCEVKKDGDVDENDICVYTPDKSDWWRFRPKDLEYAVRKNDTPQTTAEAW